jgi:hypothetical protein
MWTPIYSQMLTLACYARKANFLCPSRIVTAEGFTHPAKSARYKGQRIFWKLYREPSVFVGRKAYIAILECTPPFLYFIEILADPVCFEAVSKIQLGKI